MYPDFDFTQATMNEDASQSFGQAEKQLEDIIEHLKAKIKWHLGFLISGRMENISRSESEM